MLAFLLSLGALASVAGLTIGTLGDDTLAGSTGDDTLRGEDGDDILGGIDGYDVIEGGNGDDSLYAGVGSSDITGDAGEDLIIVNSKGYSGGPSTGPASVNGGSGDDTIAAAGYDHLIRGKDGDDLIIGTDRFFSSDVPEIPLEYTQAGLTVGSGNGTFLGNEGNDTLISAGDFFSNYFGGTGDDSLRAVGDFDLFGSYYASAEALYGGVGNDVLELVDLNRTDVFGGRGEDTILLRNADTFTSLQDGDPYIFGGVGDDELYGGYVAGQRIDMGSGDDLIEVRDSNNSYYDTGRGNDEVEITGVQTKLELRGGDDFAVLTHSGAGDDIFAAGAYVDAGNGADTVSGTISDDTIRGVTGDDVLMGMSGDDILAGGLDNDSLFGGTGIDMLRGGQGADEVYGVDLDANVDASGADIVMGNAGNDMLFLGAGDTGTGGSGSDTFNHVENTAGASRIVDYDPAEDALALVYDGPTAPSLSDISVTFDATTSETTISLGGSAAMIVEGTSAGQITASDVALLSELDL